MSDPSDDLPETRPQHFDGPTLLALRHNPARTGAWAMEVRYGHFGAHTLLRSTPSFSAAPPVAAVLRRDERILQKGWPDPAAWQPGDRVLIAVEPDDPEAVIHYIEYLAAVADRMREDPPEMSPRLGPCAIAPYSHAVGGTHRLWMIAAARLALPASVRVEARHDLIGIQLAQVALGFGADTLAGPFGAERHLPVAGVTRPNENSPTALRSLIEQAGLECVRFDTGAPEIIQTGRHTVPIQIGMPLPGPAGDNESS